MATLLYSPGVSILISTAREGIIDVSDDISSGNLSLRKNQPHLLRFSLINHRRKYDGVFTPNDRLVVRLKRIKWMQVMAGYLTQVPFFTAYPGSVALVGECTLKRLRFRLWDPGAVDTVNFLNNLTATNDADGKALDESFRRKAIEVLTNIAQWNKGASDPTNAIHIGRVPETWIERVDSVQRELGPAFAVAPDLLGVGAAINGTSIADDNGSFQVIGGDGKPETGKGYGVLPYTMPKVMPWYTTGRTLYTGEFRDRPLDQWYCAIRAPWTEPAQLSSMTDDETNYARAWWTNRKLLLVNAKTNDSLVVRVADDGPVSATGKDIGLTGWAMGVLNVHDGDNVLMRFAKPGVVVGSDGIITPDTGQPSGGTGGVTTNPPAGDVNADLGSQASLKGNVIAAWDFLAANWPGIRAIGGFRSGNNAQDHGVGLAIDVMMTMDGTAAEGEDKERGNSIAAWFVGNPNAFNTKYVIWYGRINSDTHLEEGWRTYTSNADNSANQLHMNHVHISFRENANIPPMGALGSPWKGSSAADFEGGFGTFLVTTGVGGSGSSPMVNDEWFYKYGTESTILFGIRALMNDEPIMPFIETLMKTSMRHFCSGPDGSFIGWFPDYFGIYGTAGRMMIENIELKDLSMVWNDERLKTHVFTAGSMTGIGSPLMQESELLRKVQTQGIATVEFPSILKALINVDENNPDSAGWLNPKAILDRFGARQEYQSMGALSSPRAEFWYVLALFQENWASQFSAEVPITFMPELFPGMLMALPAYGIQFYVDGVDHSWNFQDGGGGGFDTTVYVSAPSSTDSRGLFGLPRGGRL